VLRGAGQLTGSRHRTERIDVAARLQKATKSERPVLLRLESTGHLAGSLDQTVDETTDWHAFLLDQLGLGYHLVAPG